MGLGREQPPAGAQLGQQRLAQLAHLRGRVRTDGAARALDRGAEQRAQLQQHAVQGGALTTRQKMMAEVFMSK